eukprot:Blabericola_migrator_1__5192@NODE_2678_length_2472_cov_196_255717_g1625_i1_p3_GENE_NODE_2678_length_2472_cov_196_255717_g1625_i1NODE_2678_length_2472_cov_196_255717_g1625_i1_p3_ORF_typecomplete_len226_score46_87Motile_Sperm/PF00635_26/2_5e26Motile_Sperm/PF00635_26/2_6e03PapDlike/PF14874_6/0_00066DUF5001/PF16392_5/0_02ASH/PF15780_5/0_021PapD_N/PF00345_20/0_087TMEM131_like/PF12371_8/0_15SOG2/PF10428_9/0_074Unstab_antitox/PF09720_10/1_1e03Unstab_antitox/PF09720_10/0_78TSNAXIP1_N/PF15739_5/0_25HALZ/
MSEMASLGGILNYYPEKMLEFNVVGGSQSQVTLQLENPSDTHVAFKIKTTAPKSYLVKPSSGVVPPNGRQQISILLIPLYEPPRESTPDRFLVQSTVIANAEPLSKEAWADLAVMKEKLHEKRLSVHLNWMGYGSTQTKGEVSDGLQHIIGHSQPTDTQELKQKYDELIAYCLATEKQKKELEAQLDELKSGTTTTTQTHHSGMEYWQVILLIGFVVVALRTFQI